MNIAMGKRIFPIVLMFVMLFAITGCTNTLDKDEQLNKEGKNNKGEIVNTLNTNKEIFNTTWSTDEKAVVYIQTGKPEKNGLDEAYIWKVGEEHPIFIRDVSPTTYGFTWSPDNQYCLISEKLGEGVISIIFEVKSLTEEAYKIESITVPVWSADSKALAYGNEQHDYGDSWGSLEIYKLGQPKAEYIWYAMNYLYKVDSWDAEGNIGYSEVNAQGEETSKTTKNIRPSISGVHLGDSKEQVSTALGEDYVETPPSGESGHFPEQVHRWDYAKGYKVFIGADTGEVLEIIATEPEAESNLGAKIGDRPDKVFEIYRPAYIEPESIHGDKLIGTFKVEGAAALFFAFDLKEGMMLQDIKPENKVVTMILTYPSIMDDSF